MGRSNWFAPSPPRFHPPRQCPVSPHDTSASLDDSPCLPRRRCLPHRPALREDETTASDPSLGLVHRPRQSLLWRPSPISSHDDCCCPTRRQRVLHPHRRRRGLLSWFRAAPFHFHQPRRCHSSLLGDSVSLHASRRQWHRVIPRHPSSIPMTIDVVDDRFSTLGALSTWPACYSTVPPESQMMRLSVSLSKITSVGWFNWSGRFLVRCHRPALCHSSHLASIPRCGDSRSQQRSPCPRHPRRDRKGWRVGLSHPLRRFLQRQWRRSAPTERWLQRKKEKGERERIVRIPRHPGFSQCAFVVVTCGSLPMGRCYSVSLEPEPTDGYFLT